MGVLLFPTQVTTCIACEAATKRGAKDTRLVYKLRHADEAQKGRNSCPWLLIDRLKWLCACVMCWPHRVGVSVCHLAFIVVPEFRCKNGPLFLYVLFSHFRPLDVPKGIFLLSFHKLFIHMKVHKTTFERKWSLD